MFLILLNIFGYDIPKVLKNCFYIGGGVERFEVAGFLTTTDPLDGDAELAVDGKDDASFC